MWSCTEQGKESNKFDNGSVMFDITPVKGGHTGSYTCWCNPVIKFENNCTLVIHNEYERDGNKKKETHLQKEDGGI